jgi:SAM-dependent methyltransferase
MTAPTRLHQPDRRLFLGSLLLGGAPLHAQEQQPAAPYVPTPMTVVHGMLDLARVRARDVVYDLGCGDGRIVITAAKERGARGVGIDIDPQRIAEARAHAEQAGVADRVEFRIEDLFQADFSRATVVMLYLLPWMMERLRPRLWRQLRVGTRIVAHDFDMGPAWPAEQMERVDGKTLWGWTIRAAHKRR